MIKINYKRALIIILLSFFSFSCDQLTSVNYNNIHDPASENYIPTAPGSLKINSITENSISIEWTDKSSGEKGFIIERKESGGNSEFQVIDSVDANINSYINNFEVKAEITYSYRIKSTAQKNQSDYSSIATARLKFDPPTDLTFTSIQNSNNVLLTWKDKCNFESGFKIQQKIQNEDVDFTTIASVNSNITSFLLTSLDTTKSYSFRVFAFSDHNQSSLTSAISITYGCYLTNISWFYQSVNSTQVEFSPVNNLYFSNGAKYYGYNFSVIDADLQQLKFDYPQKASSYGKFSPSGKYIGVVASMENTYADTTTTIINTINGNIEFELNLKALSIDFSPDESKIVCSSFRANDFPDYIELIDLNTQKVIWRIEGLNIWKVKYSPKGDKIIAIKGGTSNDIVVIINPANGQILNTLDPDGYGIASLKVSKDGKYFAVNPSPVSSEVGAGPVELWDLNTLQKVRNFASNVWDMDISKDSKNIALAIGEGVEIDRISDGKKIGFIKDYYDTAKSRSVSYNYSDNIIAYATTSICYVSKIAKKWIADF
ncbi:MAG TPA: fibronectin type III domain-containing protein [Ignavibacteriaceae bacterium]|nr:fibronectin type III domain-containing protein [Ignavibacteriaceae bacterium]